MSGSIKNIGGLLVYFGEIPTEKTEDVEFELIPDEPEAPTLSRNLLDEAGLWEDKDREERKKIAKDMMRFGIGLGKINESGNTTRVDPLTGEELQITTPEGGKKEGE